MSVIITTTENTAIVDKGGLVVEFAKNSLKHFRKQFGSVLYGDGVSISIRYQECTADNETFESAEELHDWVSANLFRDGGGTGEGVQSVNNVGPDGLGNVEISAENIGYDNTDTEMLAENIQTAIDILFGDLNGLSWTAPNYDESDFPTESEPGEIGYKAGLHVSNGTTFLKYLRTGNVLPNDIRPDTATGNMRVFVFNGTDNEFHASMAASINPVINSFVIRTSGGVITGSAASNVDNQIPNVSQVRGLVNDTLSDSETSASLQALYGSVIIGTIVTVPTAGIKYRKYDTASWEILRDFEGV